MLDKISVLRLCSLHAPAHVVMHYQVGTSRTKQTFQWVAPLNINSLKETADIVGYDLHLYDGANSKHGYIEEELSLEEAHAICDNRDCQMFLYFILTDIVEQ